MAEVKLGLGWVNSRPQRPNLPSLIVQLAGVRPTPSGSPASACRSSLARCVLKVNAARTGRSPTVHQVDPIVASFTGGAVGVLSMLLLVEVNNAKVCLLP